MPRLFSRKITNIISAAVFGLAMMGMAKTAFAVPIIVDYLGTDYSVDIILTSYDIDPVLLESQIWWDDFPTTTAFTNLVNDQLGYPNSGGTTLIGPLFGTSSIGGLIWVNGALSGAGWNEDSLLWFAVAETAAIPEPASILLFGFGLMGLVGIGRRRRRKDDLDNSLSTQPA